MRAGKSWFFYDIVRINGFVREGGNVSKLCYEVNPKRLQQNCTYGSMGIEGRYLYRELLDIMWQQPDQCSVAYVTSDLASIIGLPEGVIEQQIEALCSGNSPLLEQSFCFDRGLTIVSLDLKEQIQLYKSWEKNEIEKIKKRNSDTKIVSLTGMIKVKEKSPELSYGYLEPSERSVSSFSGWFPTSNFDSDGQVYFLRNDVISIISDLYPGTDKNAEFTKIFGWLMQNPNRRQTVARMNSYVLKWFERATSLSYRATGESMLSQLDQEIEALFNEQKEASI